MKINVFYRESSEISGNGLTVNNPEILGVDTDLIDKLKDAALQAVDNILTNPEKEKNIINSLGILSESLLSDPKNVRLVLEKISKQAPNPEESPLTNLKRKALAYREVIQIHADAVNNPALKRRIIIINTNYESNMDTTKEETEEALNMLKGSIGSSELHQ